MNLHELAARARDLANDLAFLANDQQPIPPAPPEPPPITIDWDIDLTRRGVSIPNHVDQGFDLILAEYVEGEDAGGRHHIYVDVLDEYHHRIMGHPWTVTAWDNVWHQTIDKTPQEDVLGANLPIDHVGDAYNLDCCGFTITGMGLGSIDDRQHAHHVYYRFVFKRRSAAIPQG